jgi:hypothetical protein
MAGRGVIVLRGRCALGVFVGLLTVTLSVGCGKGPPKIKGKLPVFPVAGKLLMDGKPMVNATIILNPVRKWPDGTAPQRPRAFAGDDGSFKVSTYSNDDGAPAGDYKVTISWKGDVTDVTSEQQASLPEKVPEAYQSARNSRIRIKVKEEDNTLPTWDIAQLDSHVSNSP